MGLALEQFVDLLSATQNHTDKGKFEDIASDLTRYVFMDRIVKQNRINFQYGPQAEWELMTDENGSAQHVSELQQISVGNVDVLAKATAPWRNTIASYVISRGEMLANLEPGRIVNLVTVKRASMMLSLIKKLESAFWSYAADTDTTTPWGLYNWIVTNATEGFNGGTPGSWTTVGGLSPTTTPNWKNYTFQYAAVSKTDLIRKWRKACTLAMFESPIGNLTNGWATMSPFQHFTCYDVISAIEEIAEQQNDQLGNDVATMDGHVMFRKQPVIYVPKLDADTTDPVISLNMGTIQIAVLGGEWMREENFPPIHTQPDALVTHTFNKWNTLCRNRRANIIGYK